MAEKGAGNGGRAVHGADVPAKPSRIWPILLVLPAAFVLGHALEFLVFRAFAVLNSNWSSPGLMMDEATRATLLPTVKISAMLALEGGILLTVLLATAYSPEGFVRRLNLGPSRLPLWSYVPIGIGTIFVTTATWQLIYALKSDRLLVLARGRDDALAASAPGTAVLMALAFGVIPGFAEEILFRGYVQSRLIKRGAWMAGGGAIVVTALVFGVFHLSPIVAFHAAIAGCWIGYVSAKAGSIRPAIFAHAVLNTSTALWWWLFARASVGASSSEAVGVIRFTPIFVVVGLAVPFGLTLWWLRKRGGSASHVNSMPGPYERGQEYARGVFGDPDEQMRTLMDRASAAGLPRIAVSADVGRLLAILAGQSGRNGGGAGLIVELGTLAGYSGLWLVRGLRNDGTLITVEPNALHADFAQKEFEAAGVGSRVRIERRTGLEAMAKLREEFGAGSVDVVFADAVKTEYPAYVRAARDLLREGGLLIMDNAMGSDRWWISDAPGSTPERDAVDVANRMVAEDPGWLGTLVAMRQGVLVARRGRD